MMFTAEEWGEFAAGALFIAALGLVQGFVAVPFEGWDALWQQPLIAMGAYAVAIGVLFGIEKVI